MKKIGLGTKIELVLLAAGLVVNVIRLVKNEKRKRIIKIG